MTAFPDPSSTVPQIAELHAPPSWGTVDFISDLHLQEADPATFTVWRHYMQNTPADAVFILGDLFEAWVGDDVVSTAVFNANAQSYSKKNTSSTTEKTSLELSFEDQCALQLRQTATRLALFFMHGNRDFLVGQAIADTNLMALCNTTLLTDPTVLVFNRQRWLLSHGDALCLADTDYMQFRQQVRSLTWQQAFLNKPLTERQAIARELRRQSELRKQSGLDYADVDTDAARAWLAAANASTLIHGHTHKPAQHDLGNGLMRVVLSDWDMHVKTTSTPRAEVLRLSANGLQRIDLTN